MLHILLNLLILMKIKAGGGISPDPLSISSGPSMSQCIRLYLDLGKGRSYSEFATIQRGFMRHSYCLAVYFLKAGFPRPLSYLIVRPSLLTPSSPPPNVVPPSPKCRTSQDGFSLLWPPVLWHGNRRRVFLCVNLFVCWGWRLSWSSGRGVRQNRALMRLILP